MEEYIFNGIEKYFRTLRLVGTIDNTEKIKLFITSSIYNIYTAFKPLVVKTDAEKLNKYLDCLLQKSCLLGKNVPCLQAGDAIITIQDNIPMGDIEGNVFVTNERKTKKFVDFVISTQVEPDQYVVGYDQSDNNEVAINVNDLGVFWDVDI